MPYGQFQMVVLGTVIGGHEAKRQAADTMASSFNDQADLQCSLPHFLHFWCPDPPIRANTKETTAM